MLSSREPPRSLLGASHVAWSHFKVVSEPVYHLLSALFAFQLVSVELVLFRGGPYRAVVNEPALESTLATTVLWSESAFTGRASCGRTTMTICTLPWCVGGV